MTGDHWVYRIYDAEARLIYVGITSRGIARLDTHAQNGTWGKDVVLVGVEHFPTRADALAREAALIREFRPKHNTVGSAPLPPAEGLLSVQEVADLIQMSPAFIRKAINVGELAAVRHGRTSWIARAEFDRWMDSKVIRP